MGLKIAVLDDYQSLSAPYIRDLLKSNPTADITVYSDTILPSVNLSALIARLSPFNVLVTMRERTPLPRIVFESLPNLRVVFTTGLHNRGIDLVAAKELGILVAGTPAPPPPPDVPKDFNPTVQHTIALILALAGNVPRDDALVSAGSWLHSTPLNTYLGGLTLGVIGLGRLGVGVARIAHVAFGMRVIAWSPNLTQAKADDAAVGAGLAAGTFSSVSKDELFTTADVVSVHIVLSDRSVDTVTERELAQLKPTALLVNTSRGPLINEADLLDHLDHGRIRGAALDVFDIEPLPLDSRWRTTKWGSDGRSQVVLTPHSGYSFEHALGAMWEATTENLHRLLNAEEVQWVMNK